MGCAIIIISATIAALSLYFVSVFNSFVPGTGVLLGLFGFYLSRYYISAGFGDFCDDHFTLIRGLKREQILRFFYKDIDSIMVSCGGFTRITIYPKPKGTGKAPIFRSLVSHWDRNGPSPLEPAELWLFQVLNKLSDKCNVYVKKWYSLGGQKRKWKPTDVWVPFEERSKEKHS